ncbi:MAG: hypothetical protein AAFR51_03925 [Pseudomonadota bacterium]
MIEFLQSLNLPDHKKPYRSPFAGGPDTHETTLEDGTQQITVVPSAITPLRAKFADWLSWMATLTAISFCIYFLREVTIGSSEEALAIYLSPFAAYFLTKFVLYRALKKSVRVVYTPDRLSIHKVLGVKRFDRAMPHSFALYHHEKKDREEELLSYREKKRAGWWFSRSPKRYCGKSFYISFEYMGQRNDVMLVYKRKTAQQIIARLKACDEVMDGYRGNGRGHTLSPEDEWTDQAGSFETVGSGGGA